MKDNTPTQTLETKNEEKLSSTVDNGNINSINNNKKLQIMNQDRFNKINKWRMSQKSKVIRQNAKIEEERQRLKDKEERERLRKEQEKQKKEKELRVRLEAKKLREEHERLRRKMEKELNEDLVKNKIKDKVARKEIDKKTDNQETREENKIMNSENEVDPLDAYINSLETREGKKVRRKANTKLSKRMRKTLEKTVPRANKIVKVDEREVLENESKYEAEDLVIKTETSWLDKMKHKKKEIKPVDHEKMEYAPFRKDFYLESAEISSMTDKEVEEYRREKLEGVKIRGKDCPRPIFKWSQCGLPDKIYSVIKRLQYSEPFPIQCQAIPCIMAGRDVIASAKTGSGKTLAFILPMFRHILDQPPLQGDDGPIGLIITPTRELAKQIYFETVKFAEPCGLRTVCCHGGATMADQIADLKRGAEIIVATPGRMIDMLCINSGRVTNTRRVTYLVMDEADRMFDMGFEPQIMTIINNTRPSRQTVMFSATFPRQIEGLVKQIMQKPVEIVIGDKSVASNAIIQTVKILEEHEKFNALLKILGENYYKGQILIFTDRQHAVDQLFSDLQRAGYFTLTLHGGMDQFDRDSMIQDFKNKTRNILIATSIAARGLDVQDLNLVINYTVPNHYEDYVHRIGRTGRAGKTGYAITFITPSEEKFAPDLIKALKLAKQACIPHKLEEMAESFKKKLEEGKEKCTPSVRSSGSKGFKFDETEEYEQKLEKQRQEVVYGASARSDKSDAESQLQQAAGLADSENLKDSKGKQKNKPKTLTMIERQLAAAKAGAAAIKTTLNIAKKTHSADDVHALAQVAYQSIYIESQKTENSNQKKTKAEAVAKSLALSQKLASLGASATPAKLAAAFNPNQFSRTFVVNDYPQQVRYTVTSKKISDQIKEFADVKITTRGSFFAPGRVPAVGEEKLSVRIEGKNPMDVERAFNEIRLMAEELASSTSGPSQSSYGKYQVV